MPQESRACRIGALTAIVALCMVEAGRGILVAGKEALLVPSSWPADRTLFQEGDPCDPRFDLRTDAAITYGINRTLPARVAGWRERGYRVHVMTGLAWGNYQDYLLGRWDGRDHWDDAQRQADGKPRQHGPDIPYMVPSDAYAAYLESLLRTAIEAGVEGVFLEEPEFWASTGYGRTLERAWLARYDTPYRDPALDPQAFALAAELKHELYRALIDRLCNAVSRMSAGRDGGSIPCHVATHSLMSYAYNNIVSPVSALRAVDDCRGVILQVWSHTARCQVMYEGQRCEKLLEVGFLEYASGLELVRGTDRHLWFLADPVEDRPDFGWARYRSDYHATIVASLFHPSVCAFEVMPWPMRVFTGLYPRRADGPPGDPIPEAYASELLAIANALSAMPSEPVAWDCGTRGVGVLTADSLMFRRRGPAHDDPELSAFFGLALPPICAAMTVQPVSLETVGVIGVPEDVRVLLLSYDGMTPPSAAAHEGLAAWVRAGNALVLFGSADGPYERVPAWWNDGVGGRGPLPHLAGLLGVTLQPGMHRAGKGVVCIELEGPVSLARRPEGAGIVRTLLRRTLDALGADAPAYREQRYMVLRRGPYVIAAAPGEWQRDPAPALSLEGCFVDMLDGSLPVRRTLELHSGEHAFLLDVEHRRPERAAVLAASGRVRDVVIEGSRLSFRLSGPSNTGAAVRLLLPSGPRSATAGGEQVGFAWDAGSRTALLRHENQPGGVEYRVEW